MHFELPDALAEQVSDAYEDAGYASKSDLIRDATRRRLEELNVG